jgi:hypothetical protein
MTPALEPISGSQHPSEDALEEYVLRRMTVTDQACLESHLLCCTMCCERLEESSGYIEAFRCALLREPERCPRALQAETRSF